MYSFFIAPINLKVGDMIIFSQSRYGSLLHRYAQRFISARREGFRRFARATAWKNLTVDEFKKFLAVLYNMGLIKKAAISEYWIGTFGSQKTDWFGKVMSRNRFQYILKFLHISDVDKAVDRQVSYTPINVFPAPERRAPPGK